MYYQKSKVTQIIIIVGAIMAGLLTISWFMPVTKIYGMSLTLLDAVKLTGNRDGAVGFWFMVILSAASIVWTIIYRKWASIVGAIQTFILMIFCLIQVGDWLSKGFELTAIAMLMGPLSMGIFIVSIVKLYIIIKSGY